MRRQIAVIGMAVGMAQAGLPAIAASPLRDQTGQVVAFDSITDPLLAVESNRLAIVNRLVLVHANSLAANGISTGAFREALLALRADQLLAASLVNTLEEVTAIVAYEPKDGQTLQRFVPVAPKFSATLALPPADAYLVREGDALTVVKAADLSFRPMSQLVGYFVFTSPSVVVPGSAPAQAVAKDSPGTGPSSWLGCTFCGNVASGAGSAVAAGTANAALGDNSFVGAGKSNVASGLSSTVLSGFDNQATVVDSTVIGGAGNRATGARAVVIGGGYNVSSGQWSIVGGGGRSFTGSALYPPGTNQEDNVASGDWSGVFSGQGNRATGERSFIGGGDYNLAAGRWSVVAGGGNGVLSGNIAGGDRSSILGGFGNSASGDGASVAGGVSNSAGGDRSFTAGNFNSASGVASVALGNSNSAIGVTSFALGIHASAADDHSFVFSGDTGGFSSTGPGSFNVFAPGGAAFLTQSAPARQILMKPNGTLDFPDSPQGRQAITMAGVGAGVGWQSGLLYVRTDDEIGFYRLGSHSDTLEDPGVGGSILAVLARSSVPSTAPVTGNLRVVSVTQTSDRNAKTAFRPVDPRSILERVAQMPITSWAYKHEESAGIRHIGPVSQDFMRLFQIGYDDKSISTVDEGGVALAAIKGLKQELDERNAQLDSLRRELAEIKEMLARAHH